MKVVTTQPGIDRAPRFSWAIYKRTISLILIASFLSFAVGWAIKGEVGKYGGARWALHAWAHAHGNMALTKDQSYVDVFKIPYYLLTPTDMPQFVVDVDFKSFEKIQKKRAHALEKGLLVTGKDDFVSAKIRFQGDTTRVKVRLKGDLLDHLKGDKWSFRVKVKGKDQLLGMRVFSIQSPLVRGFHGGPLFYETMKRYGVLAPRTHLVNAVVNGSSMGVMSVEEHFSKEMLEANGRKESVIIRFDESLVWDAVDGKKRAGLGGHFDNYHVATIDGFGSGKIKKSKTLSRDYEVAVGLLRAFEDGSLPASEVFDSKLMGRYIAVSELWGSWHSFSWRNLRFYYNPITAKLEPIANDPDTQTRSKPGKNRGYGEPVAALMRSALLDDPAIYSEFESAVKLISDDVKNGSLFEQLGQLQDELLPILRKEFYLLRPFDESELVERIKLLENYDKADLDELYKIDYAYPELVKAYEYRDDDENVLELANITPSPVDVLSIRWVNKKDDSKSFDVDFRTDVRYPFLLQPASHLSRVNFLKLSYEKDKKLKKDYRIEIKAKVSDSQDVVSTEAVSYQRVMTSNPIPTSDLQQQASIHEAYLVANGRDSTMTIKPGNWIVRQPIIVPENTVLKMSGSTVLEFAEDAAIVSRGNLHFVGSEDAPVVLKGVGDKSWPGLAVLNADKKSRLSQVQIKQTKGMTMPQWGLTGGVSFYRSDVEIESSRFEDSRGEDALNIIHSQFTLTDVDISRTASDAFDADFATGNVIGGLYKDIGLAGGGDAIDVSGSDITVENTRFENVDDKSISVGEQSKLQASGVVINGTGTGAASKDASVLKIMSSEINDARVAGLLAYIKKPEFGPGKIIAKDIHFGDGFDESRAQKGSSIKIDDEYIETIDIDVKDMYKTVMKKGLK